MNILSKLIVCSCLLVSFAGNLPAEDNPYENIEVLPFDPQGWYGNANQIKEIFKNNRHIQTVVEVGSWLGASTRHIATLLPQGGKVYAVDTWLGSVEHQLDPKLPTLYQQFLSNVIHAQLTDRIIPVRMESVKAAECLKGLSVDLVYLDGAHDTASVLMDLRAWYPYVQGHGIICGDDWGWDSVKTAVRIFAKENGLRIGHHKNFWRLK